MKDIIKLNKSEVNQENPKSKGTGSHSHQAFRQSTFESKRQFYLPLVIDSIVQPRKNDPRRR